MRLRVAHGDLCDLCFDALVCVPAFPVCGLVDFLDEHFQMFAILKSPLLSWVGALFTQGTCHDLRLVLGGEGEM